MKRFLLILLDIWIFLNIVIFLTSIFLFFHGSFEMYPTEEQDEKMKIAAAFLGILSFAVGALLTTCRVKLG
ncbi:MAG: hypothetical protein K2N90_06885, partial [Lachnospiraceae bacterium]|nr:hypothetical protein [Lachnospiraceae bacterium]